MRTSLPLSLSLGLLLDLVHREIIAPQIAPLTDHSNLHQPFIFLVPKTAKLYEIHTSIFRILPWKCGIFALAFSVRTKEVLLPGKGWGGTAIYGLYLVCAAVKDMVFKLFTLG